MSDRATWLLLPNDLPMRGTLLYFTFTYFTTDRATWLLLPNDLPMRVTFLPPEVGIVSGIKAVTDGGR